MKATGNVTHSASAPTTRNAEAGATPPAPFSDWRSAAMDLLNAVSDCIGAARQIDANYCPVTQYLLVDAAQVAERAGRIPTHVASTAHEMLDEIYHLEALLKGACALDETPEATVVLLSGILDRLDESSALFDLGGLPDKGVAVVASGEASVSDAPRADKPSTAPRSQHHGGIAFQADKLLKRSLGLLKEAQAQSEMAFAVASGGRAYSSRQDTINEMRIFEAIEEILSDTTVPTALERTITEMASLVGSTKQEGVQHV